jgi:hypothetical protein
MKERRKMDEGKSPLMLSWGKLMIKRSSIEVSLTIRGVRRGRKERARSSSLILNLPFDHIIGRLSCLL